jgi:RHS repeat-associated protein
MYDTRGHLYDAISQCTTNSCFSRCCYTGKERDAESGNDYFFARYYNSAIGRFTTPDWSAKTDPVPYAVFTDPQSLNLYAYVRNNPLTSVDPDGHCCEDALNFVGGLFNALGSDNAMGAGRVDQTTTAGQMGAKLGDGIATVQGFAEMGIGTQMIITGGLEALATSPATETGVPAAGVALAVGGMAVDAHGSKVATQGLVHSAQDASQSSSGSGKAPKGDDGHPMELHHEGQGPKGPVKEMTRTEHRLGDNFKKNHTNTGQKPSKIDRGQFKKFREKYWKDKQGK